MVTYNGVVVTPGYDAHTAHPTGDPGISQPPGRTKDDSQNDENTLIVESSIEDVSDSSSWGLAESPSLESVESESFRFFDLSFDLRQAVLAHVFSTTPTAVFLRGYYHLASVGIPFPPVIRTTKRLRAESLYAGLNQTELKIRDEPSRAALAAWLNAIDFTSLHGDTSVHIRTGFDAVQKLYFPFFFSILHWPLSTTALDEDSELIKKCHRLHQVTLKVPSGNLVNNVGTDLFKTPMQPVDRSRMAEVFKLEKLEKLILVKCYENREIADLTELKEWLDVEFKKLGREVVVSILESERELLRPARQGMKQRL